MSISNEPIEFGISKTIVRDIASLLTDKGFNLTRLTGDKVSVALCRKYNPLFDVAEESLAEFAHKFDVYFVAVPGSERHLMLWIVKDGLKKARDIERKEHSVLLVSFGLDQRDSLAGQSEKECRQTLCKAIEELGGYPLTRNRIVSRILSLLGN